MATEEQRSKFRARLLTWSNSNLLKFPWRETDSPYKILVTEILLQRTLAQKVVPLYEELFSKYSTSKELGKAEVDDVAGVLEPLGLQNRRGEALVKIGNRLSESEFPKTEEEFLKLPFVGLYAANATLCFAVGQRRPVVDVNVIRVYGRVFDFDWSGDRDDHAWEFAEEMLPDEDYRRYNLALLDLGAQVCKSANPDCTV